jgi:hypothetical protein
MGGKLMDCDHVCAREGGNNYAFLVTGSNSSGKTTTVERVLERLRATEGCLDGWLLSIRADNDNRYKGKAEDQEAKLTDLWHSDTRVLIIEGTRINTPLLRVARAHRDARVLEAIVTVQRPDVMRAHLEARCARKGKVYRAEYWTPTKLRYEGYYRYPNSMRRSGVQPKVFEMDLDYRVTDEVAAYLEGQIRKALV